MIDSEAEHTVENVLKTSTSPPFRKPGKDAPERLYSQVQVAIENGIDYHLNQGTMYLNAL